MLHAELMASKVKEALGQVDELKDELNEASLAYNEVLAPGYDAHEIARLKIVFEEKVSQIMALQQFTNKLNAETARYNKLQVSIHLAQTNLTAVQWTIKYYQVTLLGQKNLLRLSNNLYKNQALIKSPPSTTEGRMLQWVELIIMYFDAQRFTLKSYVIAIQFHRLFAQWQFHYWLYWKVDVMQQVLEAKDKYAVEDPDLYGSLNREYQKKLYTADEGFAVYFELAQIWASHHVDIQTNELYTDQMLWYWNHVADFFETSLSGKGSSRKNDGDTGDSGDAD